MGGLIPGGASRASERTVVPEVNPLSSTSVVAGNDVNAAREAMVQLGVNGSQLNELQIDPAQLAKTYGIATATLGVMQQQGSDGGAVPQFQVSGDGKAEIVIATKDVALQYKVQTVVEDSDRIEVKATFSDGVLRKAGVVQEDAQRAFSLATNAALKLKESGEYGGVSVAVSPNIVQEGRGSGYFQVVDIDPTTKEVGMIISESIGRQKGTTASEAVEVQGFPFKKEDWVAAQRDAANLVNALKREGAHIEDYVVRSSSEVHTTKPNSTEASDPHLRVVSGRIGEKKNVVTIPIAGAADREL